MKNKVSESDIQKLFYGIIIEAVDELRVEFEQEEEYEICAKMVDIKNKFKKKLDGTRIQSTADTGGGESI